MENCETIEMENEILDLSSNEIFIGVPNNKKQTKIFSSVKYQVLRYMI